MICSIMICTIYDAIPGLGPAEQVALGGFNEIILLQTVLAPAQDAGDLAVPVAGATIDLVRDEHRSTVFQAPHRPNMRQATGVRRDTLGKDGLGSLSLRDFVVGGYATASSLWLALASFLAASLLSLFFRSSREWFVDLRRRRAIALFLEVFDALVQLVDALVRGFEFTAQVHDQINEPFGADPPLFQILVERLDEYPYPIDASQSCGSRGTPISQNGQLRQACPVPKDFGHKMWVVKLGSRFWR